MVKSQARAVRTVSGVFSEQLARPTQKGWKVRAQAGSAESLGAGVVPGAKKRVMMSGATSGSESSLV